MPLSFTWLKKFKEWVESREDQNRSWCYRQDDLSRALPVGHRWTGSGKEDQSVWAGTTLRRRCETPDLFLTLDLFPSGKGITYFCFLIVGFFLLF